MADVLDLGSRRVVGFAMAEHMRTELVAEALDMAVAARGGDVADMIFHHDRGTQYMSRDFRELCGTYRWPSRSDASARARTTRWLNRSGPASNESSSVVVASSREQTLAGPSSPGSITTTRCACTPRSETSRPSSGSCDSTLQCGPERQRRHETVLSDRLSGSRIHRAAPTTRQIAAVNTYHQPNNHLSG